MDKLSQPTNYDKRLYSLKDYEELANTRFDRHANDYYNSGANDEISLNNQEGVYKSIKLKTRVFVDPNKF
jgi:(S)-2-hydroxy-acid oxidase